MIRSMFTAITALGLHQTYMDVVADNLANSNTPGFKASRVMFQDLFAQVINAGSAPSDEAGGINPTQIGLGLKLGNISPYFTQGTLNGTGRITDLAVQGEGFFIYRNAEGATTYSRESSLQIDADGYLVNASTGNRMMGWNADDTGNIDTSWLLDAIRIPLNTSVAAETTQMTLGGNLDSATDSASADPDYDVTVGFFDSLGVESQTTMTLTRMDMGENFQYDTGGPDQTDYVLSSWSVTPEAGTTLNWGGAAVNPAANEELRVAYDQNGQLRAIWVENTADGDLASGGTTQLTDDNFVHDANFETDLDAPNPSIPSLTVPGTNGAEDTEFFVDPRDTSMLSLFNTVSMDTRNGNSPGSVTDIHIAAENGNIYSLYSNGAEELLGKVGLAKFTNPSGLLRRGNSEYIEGINSGPPQVGAPNTGGRGTVNPGYLESSNVDLGREFTDMILAQRGFQASSRVIRSSDEMLLELVNLKR